MTIDELKATPTVGVKALAYDCIVTIETAKQSLNVIQQELAKRQQMPPQAPTAPDTDKPE
jgi:hypothetical protein